MFSNFDLIYDLSMVSTHGPLLYDRFSKEYLSKNYLQKKILIFTRSKSSFNNIKNKNLTIKRIYFNNFILRNIELQIKILWIFITNKTNTYYSPFDISPIFNPVKNKIIALRNPTPFIKNSRSKISKLIFFFIVSVSVNKCKKIICPSNFAKRLYRRYYQIPNEKLFIIYHGFENENFKKKNLYNFKYIIFLSNFYYHKNFHLVLDSYIKYLDNSSSGIKLLAIGSIINKEYFKNLTLKIPKKYSNMILFKHDLNRESVINSLLYSEFLFLPTEAETFCHPFCEAQIYKKKILCLNNSFSKEICRNNAIYSAKNTKDLSKNISKAILSKKRIVKGDYLRSYNFEMNSTFDLIFLY